MTVRPSVPFAFVALVGILLTAGTAALSAQQGKATRAAVSKTPWGDPDLQGMWTNNTATPFERPDHLAAKERLTPTEISEIQDREQKRAAQNSASAVSGPEHWYEHLGGVRSERSAMIVDPRDGKVPALTPEAEKRRVIGTTHRTEFHTWEDLSPWDRCITRGVPGSMLPTFYNNNYQILQTPGYVTIVYEMIHDVRVIPLDGRRHLSSGLQQWMGDSRGHWEGNTLVVEVTNFTDKTPVHPVRGTASKVAHSKDLRVVERFTPIDADTIEYQVTVDDSKTFARSWTAIVPMTKKGAPNVLFEYACHEGNYAVSNILRGSQTERSEQNRQ